jgi:hypothetical protein
LRDRKNRERQKRNNSPPREEPSEGKSLYAPNSKTKKQKRSRGVVGGGGLFGVVGSSAHEGVPGVGVAEIVDVGVKNDLMRAHVVALKDVGESVVMGRGLGRASRC